MLEEALQNLRVEKNRLEVDNMAMTAEFDVVTQTKDELLVQNSNLVSGFAKCQKRNKDLRREAGAAQGELDAALARLAADKDAALAAVASERDALATRLQEEVNTSDELMEKLEAAVEEATNRLAEKDAALAKLLDERDDKVAVEQEGVDKAAIEEACKAAE